MDKIVTNVTIKDAPVELNDNFLIHYMKSYGEAVEHSIKRGTIKVRKSKQIQAMYRWFIVKMSTLSQQSLDDLKLVYSLTIRLNANFAEKLVILSISVLKRTNQRKMFSLL